MVDHIEKNGQSDANLPPERNSLEGLQKNLQQLVESLDQLNQKVTDADKEVAESKRIKKRVTDEQGELEARLTAESETMSPAQLEEAGAQLDRYGGEIDALNVVVNEKKETKTKLVQEAARIEGEVEKLATAIDAAKSTELQKHQEAARLFTDKKGRL